MAYFTYTIKSILYTIALCLHIQGVMLYNVTEIIFVVMEGTRDVNSRLYFSFDNAIFADQAL